MKTAYFRPVLGLALALTSGHALALNSGSITGTEVKLYYGGATATDNGFVNLFKLTEANGGLCQDGTLDFYEYPAAGSSAKQRLFFCTGNANSNNNGGKIAVFKESNGGSAEGVIPVADPTVLRKFLPFSAAGLGTCETGSSVGVAATGDFAAYVSHVCTTTHIPDANLALVSANAGISDIDPKTFVGLGGVTAAHANSLTSTATVGVAMNTIVSTPLYEALQAAQGLTVGSNTLANVPTLTMAQARAMLSGNITNGTQLYGYNPTTGLQAQLTAASKTLYVCRRGDSSGTTTSFKILFLGQGCSKNPGSIGVEVLPTQVYAGTDIDPETGDPIGINPIDQLTAGQTWSTTAVLYNAVGAAIANGYGGIRVFGGSSSGDVRNCMIYHSGAGDYAIGTASTESKPASGATWRYVRIDGAEPTLKATMEGRYSLFVENTLNRQSDSTKSNFLTAGSNQLNLFTGVLTQIGKPLVLKAINSSWVDAAAIGTVGAGEGDTGLLDIPTSANNLSVIPVTAASVRAKAVNSQVRTYGSGINNCNMSRQFYP